MSERRVNVLALLGGSPAVVTETLYALFDEDAALSVEHLRVVGTGASQVAKDGGTDQSLLGQHLVELAQELRAGQLDAQSRAAVAGPKFECIASPGGRVLQDIRDSTHAEIASDFLFERVRELTAEGMPPLIVSTAGGRKTMSSVVAGALQLLGREGDRLVHVLVDDVAAEDRAHAFFFPRTRLTPLRHAVAAKGGTVRTAQLDHSKVRVTLSDVPFVPVRALLSTQVANLGSFVEAREFATEALRWSRQPPPVRLEKRSKTLVFAEKYQVELSPTRFVVLSVYAGQKAAAGCGPCRFAEGEGCERCRVPDQFFAQHADELEERVSEFEGRESPALFRAFRGTPKELQDALSVVLSLTKTDILERTASTPVASHAERFYVDKEGRKSLYRRLVYPGRVEVV